MAESDSMRRHRLYPLDNMDSPLIPDRKVLQENQKHPRGWLVAQKHDDHGTCLQCHVYDLMGLPRIQAVHGLR